MQAAIDQSTNAAPSAVDPPRETRSKRIRESVEPRTPSREGSSKPSSVGHQAKKSKKKRTEADTPTTSRGTPRKPDTEVPVQKHKTSRRNIVTETQEATEKPAPKAAVPKLKHLSQNTAAQGPIKKSAPQTATSMNNNPDAMNAIHKEITILMVRISASSRSLLDQTIDTDYRKKRSVAKSSTRNESSPLRDKSSPSRNRSSSLRNK